MQINIGSSTQDIDPKDIIFEATPNSKGRWYAICGTSGVHALVFSCWAKDAIDEAADKGSNMYLLTTEQIQKSNPEEIDYMGNYCLPCDLSEMRIFVVTENHFDESLRNHIADMIAAYWD